MTVEQALIDTTLREIRTALEQGDLERALTSLLRLRPEDRADAFADLDDDDQVALFPRMDTPTAADLLEDLDDDSAADVAEALPIGQLADVLDEMEPDDAADILGDLPPARAAQALAEMEDADEVIPLLGHPDETAGGLMTTSFIALRRQTTAAQAIDFLRQVDPEEETPYYLYVVDKEKRLIGVVGLRNLIVADPDSVVEDFMDRDVIRVTSGTDQEDVARLMARYDVTAIPVVDDHDRLVGVITHDDVIDVIEDEATEDVLQLGAIEPGPLTDKPYWSQRIVDVVRSRFLWLLGLFVAQTLTGTVLRAYMAELEAVVSLTLFIPLIIGTGGNAGSQTVASVIRALALDEIRRRDVLRILARELTASALLGLLLASVAYLRASMWGVGPAISLVVAFTILAVCIWANTVGSLIPLLADLLGIDPTVMSAPLISTLVDATGLLIYLSVAGLVLQRI